MSVARAPEQPTADLTAVWWLVLGLVAGMSFAVAAHYVQGAYLGREYPFSTFLFRPTDLFVTGGPQIGGHAFGDFYATWKHSGDASPYLAPSVPFPSNYLPFTHVLLKPLTWLPYSVAFAVFNLAVLITVPLLLWRELRDVPTPLGLLAAFVIGLLNYPVLFLLDRGNLEGVILLMLLGVGLAVRAHRWPWAALLIALAGAMKGFPLVFLLLLVAHRKWRWAGASVVGFASLTVLSLATMAGGARTNLQALRGGLSAFGASAASDNGLQHSSSLQGMLSVAARQLPTLSDLVQYGGVLSLAVLVVASAACASGRLTNGETTAVCAALMVLVPSVSYDYRLAHLLVPVLLLLRAPVGPMRVAVLGLLGAVLVPKGLPVLFAEVNIATVVNPLLLLTLVGVLSAAAVTRDVKSRQELHS